MPPQHRQAVDSLLSRRSTGFLREPAPNNEDLELILSAGLRAPDHGRLRPWRFVLIRDGARAAFAEVLVEALKRREESPPASMVERLNRRILGVPLLICVGAEIKLDAPIPEIEQLMSVGAAAMNVLNAVHLLGYGGMWVTGPQVYDRSVNEALGFSAPDRLIGLLFVGTPSEVAGQTIRPAASDYTREWSGTLKEPAVATDASAKPTPSSGSR
jgi:nitroreductase